MPCDQCHAYCIGLTTAAKSLDNHPPHSIYFHNLQVSEGSADGGWVWLVWSSSVPPSLAPLPGWAASSDAVSSW